MRPMSFLGTKGVSTIIGTIIILIVVVGLAGIAYTLFGGFMQASTSGTFQVIDRRYNVLTIQNIGTEDIISMRATIGGKDVELSIPGGRIEKGTTKDVTITELPLKDGSGKSALRLGTNSMKTVEYIEYSTPLINPGFEDDSLDGRGNNVAVLGWTYFNYNDIRCIRPPEVVPFDLNVGKAYTGGSGYGEDSCCVVCENVTNVYMEEGHLSQNVTVSGPGVIVATAMAQVSLDASQCVNWNGGLPCGDNPTGVRQVCIGEDDSRIVLVASDSRGVELGRYHGNWSMVNRGEAGDMTDHRSWEKIRAYWKYPAGTLKVEVRLIYADQDNLGCYDYDNDRGAISGNGAVYWDDVKVAIVY